VLALAPLPSLNYPFKFEIIIDSTPLPNNAEKRMLIYSSGILKKLILILAEALWAFGLLFYKDSL
jgi:hypothetical protein